MMDGDTTKQYEISLVLKSEEDYNSVLAFIKTRVTQVLKENSPRRLRFAYPIEKEETGFFAWLIIEASSGVVPELQKALDMNPAVLRSLIITPPVPAKSERKIPRTKENKEKPLEGESVTVVPQREVVRRQATSDSISNEVLEKKLEEILK